MAETSTLDRVLQVVQVVAMATPALLPVILGAVEQARAAIENFRAAGGTDDELVAHIAASEGKLPALVARLEAYQVQRHPDDQG